MRSLRPLALTLALTLPLGLAACGSGASASGSSGSSDMASATSSSSSSSAPMTESSTAAMADAPFGPACSAVPASGKGSFTGMAADPVATAASNNPVLSTLVTAVTKAGLGDTLNGAKDITVLAPTNDAFAALDKATLDKAMADPKGLLTTVLTGHVIGQRLSPAELPGTHKTLAGTDVTVTGSGENLMVGDAKVVCGNVTTANATVYIIDHVLLPKS